MAPTVTVRERLEQLRPLAAALDLATVGSGLGDAPAHESVARLLVRQPGPRD